jgi:hypothetical protein
MKLIAKNTTKNSYTKVWEILDEAGEIRATVRWHKNTGNYWANVISQSTLLPVVGDRFATLNDALVFIRRMVDGEAVPTPESLLSGIAGLKEARYHYEISDDYAHSNGTYARWTKMIDKLENRLKNLQIVA